MTYKQVAHAISPNGVGLSWTHRTWNSLALAIKETEYDNNYNNTERIDGTVWDISYTIEKEETK